MTPYPENPRAPQKSEDPPRLGLQFLTSATALNQCPPEIIPEVAVAGRSNAGKSSVLNRLSGSRLTARVSKTPGRTQLINFFDLAVGTGRLVDLPGYGYAAASRQAQTDWQQGVNDYLNEREQLAGLILVMDIRHPLQSFDQELLEWATASEMPLHILLNKADKLGRGAQQKTLQQVRNALKASPELSVSLFSALKGQGVEHLIEVIQRYLGNRLNAVSEQ